MIYSVNIARSFVKQKTCLRLDNKQCLQKKRVSIEVLYVVVIIEFGVKSHKVESL